MAVLRRVLLTLLLAAAGASAAEAVSEGDAAPDVSFESFDGGTVTLASLRGRVVVVDFWATWCAPCVEQLRALDRFGGATPRDEVVLVAASIDDGADAPRRFLAEKFPDAKFTAVHDEGSEALSSFGADGIPALYVLDRDGVVRASHSGPGGAELLSTVVPSLLGSAAPAPALPREPGAP